MKGHRATDGNGEQVRIASSGDGAGLLLMRGRTTSYRVDPRGEYVFGLVETGSMSATRGRRRYLAGAGDLCAWDPSAPHAGSARSPWTARLIVIEHPDFMALIGEHACPPHGVEFPNPLVRNSGLAARFAALHPTLEASTSPLECETLLHGVAPRSRSPRSWGLDAESRS